MRMSLAFNAAWGKLVQSNRNAAVILSLLQRDIENAEISFSLFHETLTRGWSPNGKLAATVHLHAATFVCVVRRIARLLDALSGSKSVLNEKAARAIKAELKKSRAFFKAFTAPRNAIEHIDEEGRAATVFQFFNLDGDKLIVKQGVEVHVNETALRTILRTRTALLRIILENYP